jgi:hypothetical protein
MSGEFLAVSRKKPAISKLALFHIMYAVSFKNSFFSPAIAFYTLRNPFLPEHMQLIAHS